MVRRTQFDVSALIRRLREEAGLTQTELAERVGTTQSVISRLESDEYEGHSLSMLYRIGAALDRRIAVTAMGKHSAELSVREETRSYGSAAASAVAGEGLSADELERLAEHLVRRLGHLGVTRADIEQAVRRSRAAAAGRSVKELRGTLEVGPGDVVEDVRRARAQRGREGTAR